MAKEVHQLVAVVELEPSVGKAEVLLAVHGQKNAVLLLLHIIADADMVARGRKHGGDAGRLHLQVLKQVVARGDEDEDNALLGLTQGLQVRLRMASKEGLI